MRYTTSWVRPSLPTEVEFAVGCQQVQDKKQNEVSPDWYRKQVDINCPLICRLCLKNKAINMLLRVFSFKKEPLTSFFLRCVQTLV